MIMKENYPLETHTVVTDDEYMLTVYRIPGPLGSIPVFLQHGLFESSVDWLHSGRRKSLAYILSNHGYDVWLGNARGSTYSKRHKRLSTRNPEYWDFSWNELGVYDIPACVTYVSRIANNTLCYIGHSMGTSSFTVMAAEKPHIAKNIRAMFGLAPVVYEYHIKQPILKFLSKFTKAFQVNVKLLSLGYGYLS
ncbi:lipase 3-like [Nasonia vitripennis]|uniref:Partial AB-hydrolase lipase domain-containing protein n=1 Tax=Nasonia vitripennis TaxID=7425 RepID=A0A7M7Q666_NASVI|nr:lipase 3-like [Nasonia vitripennis]